MTEQEARLIAKALAAEMGRNYSQNTTPRYSDRNGIDSEIERLNHEAKKINDLSLSSSFKKYGENVIGALKYGKDLHEAMLQFKDDLQKINEASNDKTREYNKQITDLIQSSKIAAQEVLQLAQYMQKFEDAVIKGERNSKAYAEEITKITKKYEDLDKVTQEYITETNKAKRIKNEEKRRERVSNASLSKTSLDIGSTFSNYFHQQSKLMTEKINAIPQMLVSGLTRGVSAAGKISLDAAQAILKYNIPTSTFAANVGRLGVSEPEVAQSIGENRFGYRLLSGKNSAVSGFTNISGSLANAMIQYGPGAESLKALMTAQSNLASFGINYGKSSNVINQLLMFKNLARSVGMTDSGLQEFTTSLVNSGLIATLEANKKFKTSKEEEKYIGKEIKERANLAKVLGMSASEMASMQRQGISQSFMGFSEYIHRRYLSGPLSSLLASSLGINLSKQQESSIASFLGGTQSQETKAAPVALVVMSEIAHRETTEKWGGGALPHQALSLISGLSSNLKDSMIYMQRADATLISSSEKNVRLAKDFGIKPGDILSQKKHLITSYLRNPNHKDFAYVQSLMSKGEATSTQTPKTYMMGMNASDINKIANTVSSIGKTPLGAVGGSVLGALKDIGFASLGASLRDTGVLGRFGEAVTAGVVLAAPVLATAIGVGVAAAMGHWAGHAIANIPVGKTQTVGSTIGGVVNKWVRWNREINTNNPSFNILDQWKMYHKKNPQTSAKAFYSSQIDILKYQHRTEFGNAHYLVGKDYMSFGSYMEYVKKQETQQEKIQDHLKTIRKNTGETAKHAKTQADLQKQKTMAKQILDNSVQELALKHSSDIISGLNKYADQ